jgi:hypothetical protein
MIIITCIDTVEASQWKLVVYNSKPFNHMYNLMYLSESSCSLFNSASKVAELNKESFNLIRFPAKVVHTILSILEPCFSYKTCMIQHIKTVQYLSQVVTLSCDIPIAYVYEPFIGLKQYVIPMYHCDELPPKHYLNEGIKYTYATTVNSSFLRDMSFLTVLPCLDSMPIDVQSLIADCDSHSLAGNEHGGEALYKLYFSNNTPNALLGDTVLVLKDEVVIVDTKFINSADIFKLLNNQSYVDWNTKGIAEMYKLYTDRYSGKLLDIGDPNLRLCISRTMDVNNYCSTHNKVLIQEGLRFGDSINMKHDIDWSKHSRIGVFNRSISSPVTVEQLKHYFENTESVVKLMKKTEHIYRNSIEYDRYAKIMSLLKSGKFLSNISPLQKNMTKLILRHGTSIYKELRDILPRTYIFEKKDDKKS